MRYHQVIRSFFLALALLFITVTVNAAEAEKSKQADVAATVNGVSIGRGELDRSLDTARQQFESIGNQQDLSSEQAKIDLEQEVLDRLIDIELMIQDSEKRNIVVNENYQKKFFDEFMKQFKDEDEYQQFLKTNEIKEDALKIEFERQLTIRALQNRVQKELSEKITVTDEEVKTFYDNNKEQFKQPEQVRARHILITVDQDADEDTKKEARKTIEEVKGKIATGEDFAKLATEYSQCPSSSQGGDLGYFSKERMVKPFADAAFNLKQGEVSDIVETKFGYHLIRVDDKKAEEDIAYDNVKEEIRKYLFQSRLEEAHQEYLQGLRDKAEIKKF